MSALQAGEVNAKTVHDMFAYVARYNGTPCQDCKSRDTTGMIYMNAISVSCNECGTASRVGTIRT